MTSKLHWHAGSNVAGYLPESEDGAYPFEDFESAKRSLIDDMLRDADNAETETIAENLTSEAEDLNLAAGPEYSTSVELRGMNKAMEGVTCEVVVNPTPEQTADINRDNARLAHHMAVSTFQAKQEADEDFGSLQDWKAEQRKHGFRVR